MRTVAVIGGGIVGLATAWALERRGLTCLTFELGAPGGAQSADESRIFRHAHRDPRQVDLAVRARQDWRVWEDEFDTTLISADGSIVLGDAAVARLAAYADDRAIRVMELESHGLRRALPILAGFDGRALIDADAGAIQTRATIAALINSVGLNLVSERVRAVLPRPAGGVDVVTESGSRAFDAAVVAAGTGTAALAAEVGLSIPTVEKAILRLTLPITDPELRGPMACIQDSSRVFGSLAAYGSPVAGNRHFAVGLAVGAGALGEDDHQWIDRLEAQTADYVRRALPGLDRDRSRRFLRLITELPWAADGLAIWQHTDTFFIAGHNLFKFAPTLGKVLADSVENGEVEPGFGPRDRLGLPLFDAQR